LENSSLTGFIFVHCPPCVIIHLFVSMSKSFKIIVLILLVAILGTGLFYFLKSKITYEFGPGDIIEPPEATSTENIIDQIDGVHDIKNQSSLANPPTTIKAIYSTGWSAGSRSRLDYLIDLIDSTELNAVVIDIKDYSGHVSYEIDSPIIKGSGADEELKILRPNALIKELHDNGIYVIGRITIFQDPILAEAHPEWALQVGTSSETWYDRKGLAWLDPASKNVWDYNIIVAKDAIERGFDEVNFDYIRFPSDGDLSVIHYPFWDEIRPRHVVLRDFFKYLRGQMGKARISADLFGLSTVDIGDLGIGQVIEDAYLYFDFVAPMVYPSHYAAGSFGYNNPALNPYEMVKYSLEGALNRLNLLEKELTSVSSSATSSPIEKPDVVLAKIRPWLQDFDLGADYDAGKVRAQIQATYDVFCGGAGVNIETSTDLFGSKMMNGCDPGLSGWMLWDPSNIYTKEALVQESGS